MLKTKLTDITLSLQKLADGFTAIADRPTDTNIVDIRQLLLPVFMGKKYNKLDLTHKLSGFIISMDRYKNLLPLLETTAS